MSQSRFEKQPAPFLLRVVLVLPLLVAGCSSAAAPGDALPTAPTGTSGLQTDSTGTKSNNAIAGIRIAPREYSLAIGGTATAGVLPVDAAGTPTLALLAGPVTWTVSNSAIATVSSTGAIMGVAAGSAKIYATAASFKDSATVVVRSSSDTVVTGTPVPPPPPPGPVASFALTVYTFGRTTPPASSRDTSAVVPMPGATVSVYKLSANPLVAADTLGIRTLVATVTADASGKAVIPNLVGGYYSVSGQATDGGGALVGQADFGPPRSAEFQIALYLHR